MNPLVIAMVAFEAQKHVTSVAGFMTGGRLDTEMNRRTKNI